MAPERPLAPEVVDASDTPDPPDPEEAAAIGRVLEGESAAFEPLVRRYLRPAFAIAHRLLGHREDAEDVVQEAFLAALSKLDSFDRSRRFGPWFYRIVWTRGLNLRKSRFRRRAESLDQVEPATTRPSPALEAERASLRAAVSEALGRLPERQRLVVQLFDLDGFSGGEIAEMLGLSPGTVRWYLHEGRHALRELLAPLREATNDR
jgi:RNA polymerase sigma-70 factor (ECF subfamily)